jgi:hypothetical protein
MHEMIVEHVEEIEKDWERPFQERLLKITVLAAAGLGFSMLAEWAYDKVRDRYEASDEVEAQPSLEE